MNVGTKLLIGVICLPVVCFMVYFMWASYGSSKEPDGVSDNLKIENQQLKEQIVKLEKETAAESTKNNILKIQDMFIDATFEIDSVSQRNKQMRPFISKGSIEQLGLNTDPPETASIQSEVLSSRNYYRRINDEKSEVLSRVSIRYDNNDKLDKNLIFSVEYTKENPGDWKVTNIRYAEDFENN